MAKQKPATWDAPRISVCPTVVATAYERLGCNRGADRGLVPVELLRVGSGLVACSLGFRSELEA